MHLLLLGCFRDYTASLMNTWVNLGVLGCPNADEALRPLFIELKEWCKSERIKPPKGNFTPSTINRKSGEYPELSSAFKASGVKTICAFLAHKAVLLDSGDEQSQMRTLVAWSAAEYLHVCDLGGMILTRED